MQLIVPNKSGLSMSPCKLFLLPVYYVGGAQVGYKDEKRVFKCRVEKTNAIVNALNRTKREEHPDLAALQEERAKEHRRYGFRSPSCRQ